MALNDPIYRGNNNLKNSNVSIGWTKEMMEEWVRCKNDPIYFSEKYIKIVHVDHGFIPIELYDFQRALITSVHENRSTVAVTGRQQGKTTTAVCIILHYVLFNDFKLVALLANKGESSREILHRIKLAYEALPDWLQQGVVEWNKGSIELENGSIVLAASASSSNIRGKSCSLVYIDETSFVEGWDEFSASVLPTLSSGKTTKLLYTSTPNGLNHFYQICASAKSGDNGFMYHEVPWWEIPGRDEAWKEETLKSLNYNMQQFEQEYCCSFQGSMTTLIEGSALRRLQPQIPCHETVNLKIYVKVEEGHKYVCVVDVSRGKGLDYSAFSIIDITEMPYRQVAVFRDNTITPIEYAESIFRLCKTYNEAAVLVEVNDIGQQVSDVLHHDYEYENILHTESAGRSGKRITGGFGKNSDPGIRTTKTVKAIGCNMLKLLIEQDKLIINDTDTIHELSTFARRAQSYQAESGSTDDIVMTLVLFGWLSDQQYFKDLTDINTLAALRQRTQDEIYEDLIPVGFINSDSYGDDIEDTTEWFGGDRWTSIQTDMY